jgi:hypothetical protein
MDLVEAHVNGIAAITAASDIANERDPSTASGIEKRLRCPLRRGDRG